MIGRWMALGGLGWINLVEAQLDDGAPLTSADVANLETIYRRLGVILDRVAPQTATESRVDTGPADPAPPQKRVFQWPKRS